MQGEEQPHVTMCEAHGLRYDPRTADGCVVCRRGTGQAVPEAVEPMDPEKKRMILLGAGAAGALTLLVLLIVALVSALGSDDEAGGEGAAATGNPAVDALVRYVEAVRTERRALPLNETREALGGMAEEARAGTLDVAARRAAIRANVATIQGQQRAIRALSAPPPAARHQQLQVEWYDEMIRLAQLNLTSLSDYGRVADLAEDRARVRTREQAERHSERASRLQAAALRHVEDGRALDAQCRRLSAQIMEEEARLIAAHDLPLSPPESTGR